MITNILKTLLTDSGCTLVLNEQEQLSNLKTDRSDQIDIIGLIIVPPSILLELRANAIPEHYDYLRVEILKQVKVENDADVNEITLDETLARCKEFITRLIATAQFKTIMPIRATRVLENRYDANVVGWSLALNLYYLHNENLDPCP